MHQIIDLSSLRTTLDSRASHVARIVATTPDIDALLATDAVVAIGVSGGKDTRFQRASASRTCFLKKSRPIGSGLSKG